MQACLGSLGDGSLVEVWAPPWLGGEDEQGCRLRDSTGARLHGEAELLRRESCGGTRAHLCREEVV
jgi:hypothetical protein